MSDETPKRSNLSLKLVEGVSKDKIIAQAALSPETGNASAVANWAQQRFGDVSLSDSIDLLHEDAEKVRGGDLSDMEATLVSQVRTLDSIFTVLATRAANSQQLHQMEVNLRLAFKAQAQARSTVEALNEMKHPRQAFFIGQQNIADQQQVNNAIGTRKGRAAPKSDSLERNPSAHLENIAIPKNAYLLDGYPHASCARARAREIPEIGNGLERGDDGATMDS